MNKKLKIKLAQYISQNEKFIQHSSHIQDLKFLTKEDLLSVYYMYKGNDYHRVAAVGDLEYSTGKIKVQKGELIEFIKDLSTLLANNVKNGNRLIAQDVFE